MESVRDKLEAILRLMESAEKIGSVDEAAAARAMLEKLAKKYKVSIDSLRSPERDYVEFKYRNKHEAALLMQVYFKIRDSWDAEARVPKRGRRKVYFFEVTPSEAIDIEIMFKFYLKAFEEETAKLLIAFIQKHEIRPKPIKSVSPDDLTDEELQREEELASMRNGMKKRGSPLATGYLGNGSKK
jgi:hypothetical protein